MTNATPLIPKAEEPSDRMAEKSSPPNASPGSELPASFTVTAELVERDAERQDERLKQERGGRQEVDGARVAAASNEVLSSSSLTSPATSGSPLPAPESTPPPSLLATIAGTHRRPGSEDFQRPRAFTTGDAVTTTMPAVGGGDSSSPPPSAVSTRSGLRLRVEQHPRLPSLPIPLAQEFSDLNSSPTTTSPTTTTLTSTTNPLMTPHPPGAFHTQTHHGRSMTLPSSPMSPLSPRRVANASTPGTYVIPMAAEGAVTMKMTPSLVMSRPMVMPPTPGATPRTRFGSLLVSGVSAGERDGAAGGEMGRTRTESDARNSPARPMRGALPALRRDGSSFYMNLVRSATSSGSRTPAAAAAAVPLPDADEDEDEEDDDDDIIDEDAAMADDAASDDDGSEEIPSRVSTGMTTPILGGMAKAVRAMGLPFGSNTPGAASTPKASGSASPFLSSTASYFRPRHTLDAEEQTPSTPTPRSKSSAGGSTSKESPALHRRSLVASGAPSGGLGTVEDDNEDGERTPLGTPKVGMGMNREFDAPIPRTTNQQQHLQPQPSQASSSSPTSYRASLYSTPLPTPTPSAFSDSTARETVYFDAESGGSDGEAAASLL
ncbi:hypothetical protein FRB90_009554, partial [Tulasnella sp. 427]